jgi:hypothetical protein
MVRVQFVREFYQGDDVVLAMMAREGLHALETAFRKAGRDSTGQTFLLKSGNQEQRIKVSGGPAQVLSDEMCVTWELPRATLEHLADKLKGMTEASVPCHNYVDIDEPAQTLYLSVDEYAYHDGTIRSVQPGIARQSI